MKSKKYVVELDWDRETRETIFVVSQEDIVESILSDSELDTIEEIIFGFWCESHDTSPQKYIDMIIENSEKFKNVKSVFFGDMEYDENELSWIEQGNYSKLWSALPNLEKLTIKGSNNLALGDIEHSNLKHIEIISGGLPVGVIKSVEKAKLPKLEKLELYLGIEDYGFDGELKDVENLVEALKGFESLKYLGIVNSDMQNQIIKLVLDSGIVSKLETLDMSYGNLFDLGAFLIIKDKEKLAGLKELRLDNSAFTQATYDLLKTLDLNISLEDVSIMELNDDFFEEMGITREEFANADLNEFDFYKATEYLLNEYDYYDEMYPLYTE